MSTYIHVPTHDGLQMPAYYVRATANNAPSLVLIQEIFGVNAAMKALATMWALQGYHVICPDLFWRQEPGLELDPTIEAEFQHGKALKAGLNRDLCLADLESARLYLSQQHHNPNCLAVGYCMGGNLVSQMAAHSPLACAISYYGVGLDEVLPTLPSDAAPTFFHIAELDQQVPEETRSIIKQHCGSRLDWGYHIHENCDHAFARPDGRHFNAQANKLAMHLSLIFLSKHVG